MTTWKQHHISTLDTTKNDSVFGYAKDIAAINSNFILFTSNYILRQDWNIVELHM